MLKRLQTALFALLFVGGCASANPTANGDSGDKQQHRTSHPVKNNPSVLLSVSNFIETYNAGITAAATVLLTLVTGGLVWVAWVQLRTTKRQLRAYVGISFAETLPPPDDLGFKARMVFRNFGQTPAYKVRARRRVKTVGGGVLKSFDRSLENERWTNAATIGVASEMAIVVDTILGVTEKAELISEVSHTIIFGDFKYQDIFKRTQTDTFCLRVYHFGKENQVIVPWGPED